MWRIFILAAVLQACDPEEDVRTTLYIQFSDGTPTDDYLCKDRPTPVYTGDDIVKANFVDVLVKALAPFDIEVTAIRPNRRYYYSMFITDQPSGEWCGLPENAGIASFSCIPVGYGYGYVFDGRPEVGVHEAGHLLGGLWHTAGPADPTNAVDATFSFPDVDFLLDPNDNPCNRKVQNSYKLLMSAWGPSK